MKVEAGRKFKGVWIPAFIWENRELSITEKVMLVEIDSLQDETRGCYAGNAHFAKFFDLSVSRVSEIISTLSSKGYVTVDQIREGPITIERQIRLVTPFGKPNPPSEKAMNPFGKGDEPPSEKAQLSNTQSNNTKRVKEGASLRFDPLTLRPDNVSEASWVEWCKFRREIKKPLTQTMCHQQAKTLAGISNADAVIAASISSGWMGLFPDKARQSAGVQRHNGFASRDYSEGLTKNEDGSYGF